MHFRAKNYINNGRASQINLEISFYNDGLMTGYELYNRLTMLLSESENLKFDYQYARNKLIEINMIDYYDNLHRSMIMQGVKISFGNGRIPSKELLDYIKAYHSEVISL